MNSTTITLSIYLANIQIQFIQSFLTTAYIIGNLSNLANILIFYQNSLRSHVCSLYFIGASIGHLLYLNLGCLTRVLWAWTRYDLSTISLPYCKIRIYFVLNGLSISRYLLCLISFDRWMITSRDAGIRKKSSHKLARRFIIIGILFLITINIAISINYIIDKNLGCIPSKEPIYSLLFTIYNIILALAPLFILIIFSILILCNIKQIGRHQIHPVITNSNRLKQRRFHKKDIQFIKLSLIQVVGYIIFNTFFCYNIINEIITQNQIKPTNQQATETFLKGMGLNLNYTYTGITFFLYTLASEAFRKECLLFIKRYSKMSLNLISK